MLERSRKVVLLIDYDNLQICASRDTPGRDLQLTPVVQLAQRYGTVILARAYAEWNLSTERLAVYKAGIEPAFAPVLRTESDRSGKSLADTVMVAEGMDMLWTLSPDVVVLATSDKDLIPLVRVAKQRGAFVVVLGSDFTAIPLREMADDHITYKQLITDASGRYTTEAGPARQPAALPEPTRRRTRERNGREARPTTPAATISTPAPAPAARPEPSATTPTPAPAGATTVPAEPVAPVGTSAATEGDGQPGSRRRRRRGSRRRSERIGQVGEAGANDLEDEQPGPLTEVIELSTPVEDEATPEPVEATPEPVEATAEATEEPDEAAPAAEPEPPAPRERRRRTRRQPVASETEVIPEPEAATEPEAALEPKVTPEPGPTAEPEVTPDSTNGAPTRRPRRVASASRGRSRPVTR
jgi:uncharacterized LabA/DUF88 family protein